MKNRGGKIVLIVILSVIAIALINVMVLSMINRDNHLQISLLGFGNKTEEIFHESYTSKEIQEIKVDLTSSKITVQQGEGDAIQITAFGSQGEKLKAQVKEGSLQIEKEKNVVHVLGIFCWYRQELIIEVPKNYPEKFTLTTASGNIDLVDLDQANVQLETSSGNIRGGNVNRGEVKSSSGNIIMGNANEMIAKSSSGKIETKNINQATLSSSSGNIKTGELGEATVKATSGSITIQKAKKLVSSVSSGNIQVDDIEGFCQIESTSGRIKIDNCFINEDSVLSAKSGNIEVNHKNDVYVETKTSSGNVKVERNNRKAEIQLMVQTTSGNIRVNG